MMIEQPDWPTLRREFLATEKFAYLNLANKAILPASIEASMKSWLADINDNAGRAAFSMDGIEETRATVARVFGAPSECIALIKNTSEGINIVAGGFPWRDGDNVVISQSEHENNTFPWRHLGQRGVEVRLAEPDADGCVTIDQYRDLVDDRTKVLAVAWVVYGNGHRADLAGLGEFCRGRGIKLVVDGIQAVGILADQIADLGADVVVAGGHKAQFSLAGAGFMYVAADMTDMLTPPYAAKYSFQSLDRTLPAPELAADAHRFEYGNPNFLGCWVQRRSAQYVEAIGLHHIEARVRELTTRLMDGAQARQIRVRTPLPWSERAGIVSLDLGRPAAATVAALEAQDIIVSHKDGHLRAAMHFYNNEDDIDRLLEGLST